MVSLLGTIATILFIAATAAQTRKSWKEGHSNGVSHGLIWMLLTGFVCMSMYVKYTVGNDLILLGSYIAQFILLAIVARYKYLPRDDSRK